MAFGFGSGVTLAQIMLKLNVDLPGFQQDLHTAGNNIRRLGYEMTSVGYRLSAAVSAPLVAAGVAATKFSADFTHSMVKTVNLARISEQQMQSYRKAILALGPAVGKGPRELAEGLYQITSAGIRGANTMNVLADAAKGSALGMGSVQEVAHLTTSAILAYGEANLTSKRAVNVFTATITEAAVEADALTNTMGRVLPIAAQLGVTYEEVGASIATMTKSGLNAEAATTALRGMLNVLASPAKESIQILATVGLTTDQLVSKIRTGGLLSTMTELYDKFQGNFDALGQLIPNIRALTGLLATVPPSNRGVYKDVLEFIKKSSEYGQGKGLLQTGFERLEQTPGFAFSQLKAKMEAVAITIGDQLAPSLASLAQSIQPVIEFVSSMVKGFASLSQPFVAATAGAVLFTIALGPLASALGNIGVLVGNIYLALTKFVEIAAVKSVILAVGVALAGWGTTILAVLAGLGAIGAIGYSVWGALTTDTNKVKDSFSGLSMELATTEGKLAKLDAGALATTSGVETLADAIEDKLSVALGEVSSQLENTARLMDAFAKQPSPEITPSTGSTAAIVDYQKEATDALAAIEALSGVDPAKAHLREGFRTTITDALSDAFSSSTYSARVTKGRTGSALVGDYQQRLKGLTDKQLLEEIPSFVSSVNPRYFGGADTFGASLQNLTSRARGTKILEDATLANEVLQAKQAQQVSLPTLSGGGNERGDYFGYGTLQTGTGNFLPEFQTLYKDFNDDLATLQSRQGAPGLSQKEWLSDLAAAYEKMYKASYEFTQSSPFAKGILAKEAETKGLIKNLPPDTSTLADKFAVEAQTADVLEKQLELSIRNNEPLQKRLEWVELINAAEVENIRRQKSRGALEQRLQSQSLDNDKLRFDTTSDFFDMQLSTYRASEQFADAQSNHLASVRADLEANGGTYAEILELAKQQDSVEIEQIRNSMHLVDLALQWKDILALTPEKVQDLNAEYYKLELALQRGPQHAKALNREFINVGRTLNGLAADAVSGLASGTLKFKDAGSQIGQALMAELIRSTFEEKKFFDFKMKANLLDYIPGLASEGGSKAGTQFVSEMTGAVDASEFKIPELSSEGPGSTSNQLATYAAQSTSAAGGSIPDWAMYRASAPNLQRVSVNAAGLGYGSGSLRGTVGQSANGIYAVQDAYGQMYTGQDLAAVQGAASGGYESSVAAGGGGGGMGAAGYVGLAILAAQGISAGLDAGKAAKASIATQKYGTISSDKDIWKAAIIGGNKKVGAGFYGKFITKVPSWVSALTGVGVAENLLKSFGLFNAPTAEKQLAKQAEEMFKNAGLYNAEGLAQTRRPGERMRGGGFVPQRSDELNAMESSTAGFFRALYGTKDYADSRAANAFLNRAQQMGQTAEEARKDFAKLASYLNADFSSTVEYVTNEFAAGKVTAEDYKKTVLELADVFKSQLGPGVDTASVALAAFDARNRIDMEAFERISETATAAVGGGLTTALTNSLKNQMVADGNDIGQAFGDALISRAAERLIEAPAMRYLTQAAATLDLAVSAKMEGDDAEYERLKKLGLQQFAEGKNEALAFLNDVSPDVQSILRSLGIRSGPQGITNQTNFGSSDFGSLEAAGGSSATSTSSAARGVRAPNVYINNEVVMSTRDTDQATYINSRNRLTQARFPQPYVALTR